MIVETGIDYPLEDVSDEILKQDLREMMRRGNRQSAKIKGNKEFLVKNYAKEVEHG